MKKFILLCITLFAFIHVQAKDLGVNISYARFMTPDNEPYLELYFALNGSSLRYAKQENGLFKGSLDVLLTFSSNNKIAHATRFRINTDELTDSNQAPPILLHQERVALPKGDYIMFIQLTDVNDASQSYPIEQKVALPADSARIISSDLVLLERFEKAQTPSPFSKSGYNLFPIITSKIVYLPPSINDLKFYIELYNTQSSLGKGASYAYRYFLIDTKTQEKLGKYGKLQKAQASDVQPVLANIAIDDLSTGTYELIVQVVNKQGETIHEKNTYFIKEAKLKPLTDILAAAGTNHQNFALNINQIDSLHQYIQYLRVVSTDAERQMQQEILDRRNQQEMQNYLFAFWEQKFPGNAEEIWKRYLSLVLYANKTFSTRIQQGYETERGYVYLTYGAPAQMEDRKLEPNLPPYQIWHYATINTPWAIRQSDKMFVFAEFQQSSNDYQLIHSTAIGEIQNRAWRYRLANGRLGPRGNLDSNSPDMGDESGSRLNNNTLIMDGGK
jgi:GWxTD domain-containing protein